MTIFIISIIVVLIIIGFLIIFFHKKGNVTFWKKVHKYPDEALKFFQENPHWLVINASMETQKNQAVPSPKEWDGPFRLRVTDPKYASILIYGHIGAYEATQFDFIRKSTKVDANKSQKQTYTNVEMCNFVAHSILESLITPDGFTEVTDAYINSERQIKFEDKDKNILKFAVCLYAFSTAIMVLRNKQGEKAEPLVRRFHENITNLYQQPDDDIQISELALTVIKYYCAHWNSVFTDAAGPTDLAFRTSETFLKPISENLSCTNEMVHSFRLPLLLNSVSHSAAKTTNEVLSNAKQKFNYEPSFSDTVIK